MASKIPFPSTSRPIYLPGEKLGQGGFGTVRRVTDVSTGVLYAAKKITVSRSDFETEVAILKNLQHVRLSCSSQ